MRAQRGRFLYTSKPRRQGSHVIRIAFGKEAPAVERGCQRQSAIDEQHERLGITTHQHLSRARRRRFHPYLIPFHHEVGLQANETG